MKTLGFFQEFNLSQRKQFHKLLSHALRGPLIGVNGYLDFLLKDYAGKLTKNQRKCIGQAREAGLSLQKIASDFIDLMTFELELVRPYRKKISLSKVLDHSQAKFNGIADSLGVRLVFAIQNGIETKGDERYLSLFLDKILSLIINDAKPGDDVHVGLSSRKNKKLRLSYQGSGEMSARLKDFLTSGNAFNSKENLFSFLLLNYLAEFNVCKITKKMESPNRGYVLIRCN
jgi:signal transduction histidine kinase